jgi:hypothetical protein
MSTEQNTPEPPKNETPKPRPIPAEQKQDKIDVGDVIMALIGLGIPFGIIALIKGQPKRGITIFAISAVMILLMVVGNLSK